MDSEQFERISRIVRATINGSTRPQIAQMTGYSKVTVWKYQKKTGIL